MPHVSNFSISYCETTLWHMYSAYHFTFIALFII